MAQAPKWRSPVSAMMGGTAPMDLQLDDNRCSSDICMSDRLIPSRGTCGDLGKFKLERDENWAPRNDYHEILSRNVLGPGALADARVLRYSHLPQQRQDSSQSLLQVLPPGAGSAGAGGHAESRGGCFRGTAGAGGAGGRRPRSGHRALPPGAAKVLDAPGLVDDFYSHPVDWSARDAVAVALSEAVFLFDVPSGRAERLLALPAGNATALRWTGEGLHLGVGTSTGEIQLWDACVQRQLRSLRGHSGRIGALAWHEHVLSSGSADTEVHHHDVRIREHRVGRLAAHADFVCGLDYSAGGALASGGNDNAVYVWESPAARRPLHVLPEHRAAVKAVRWCPWQRHVLATGGGSADRQVCLWNASSGRLLASADAGSQVTGVVWGFEERELLTAHGYSRNQLSLWRYPSLARAGELEGHSGRLLGLAQSPDGSLVCSSSADETLRFWRVFSPRAGEKRQGEHVAAAPGSSVLRTIR
uniref:CDC20/Fizzy WD40 domain-containing protein n=1 Tax=Alexandrium monilatum TaxID=311494 RepID=A0A7S4QW40_9DINO